MDPLSYTTMKSKVAANNRATDFSNELVLAVCWKESSFIPDSTPGIPGNTSVGLMQMNVGAVDTVNHNTPAGVHFKPEDMTDPNLAIQAGSYYLQIILDKWPDVTTVAQALDAYKTNDPAYHVNLLSAETCLKAAADDRAAIACLNRIHA